MVLRIMLYIAVSQMGIYAWETLMVMSISSRPHILRVGFWQRTKIFFLLFYSNTDYSIEENFTLSYSYGLFHWHFFFGSLHVSPLVHWRLYRNIASTFFSLKTLFLVCKVNYSTTQCKTFLNTGLVPLQNWGFTNLLGKVLPYFIHISRSRA